MSTVQQCLCTSHPLQKTHRPPKLPVQPLLCFEQIVSLIWLSQVCENQWCSSPEELAVKKLLIFSMLPRDCVFEEEAELQSVPITSVRAAILQCEYHCSRSSSAYPAELQKQQSKQQCPDFSRPIDTPRFSDWFQDAPTWQTWSLQHVLGLSWGLPPVGHAWNGPEQRALDPILVEHSEIIP